MILMTGDCQEAAGLMANSADPDQTAPKEQSDQGLHCLLRVYRSNILEKLWDVIFGSQNHSPSETWR